MLDWIKCCALPEIPSPGLLLVDSWTSWKDHEAIQALVPSNEKLTIKNIPASCTSLIQPLDVYFFRVFKGFIRRVHAYVMLAHDDFLLHRRENILGVLDVVWSQFTNPIFRPFVHYSWRKIGYVDDDEPAAKFTTPIEECFPKDAGSSCEIENCDDISFVRCSYCTKFLCFSHFIINKHMH